MLPLITRILTAASRVVTNPAARKTLNTAIRGTTYITVAESVFGSSSDQSKLYGSIANQLTSIDDDAEFGIKFMSRLGAEFRTSYPEMISKTTAMDVSPSLNIANVFKTAITSVGQDSSLKEDLDPVKTAMLAAVQDEVASYLTDDTPIPVNLDWRRLITNPIFSHSVPRFNNIYPPPIKKRENQLFYTPFFPVVKHSEVPHLVGSFPTPLYKSGNRYSHNMEG